MILANRNVIIKQIEELIADLEKELAETSRFDFIAVAHFTNQIKKLKQAIGLIK